jgi:hypothetical protein
MPGLQPHTCGARLCQEASTTCFRLLAFARASIDESKKKQGVGLAKDQTEDVGPWPDQTRPTAYQSTSRYKQKARRDVYGSRRRRCFDNHVVISIVNCSAHRLDRYTVTTLEISGASARRERKRNRGERGREGEKEREKGGGGGVGPVTALSYSKTTARPNSL